MKEDREITYSDMLRAADEVLRENCSQIITPEILERNGYKRSHRFFHKSGSNIELELTQNNGFILRIIEIENDNYVLWHNVLSVNMLNSILKAFGYGEIYL